MEIVNHTIRPPLTQPSSQGIDAGAIALAEIYTRVGMTVIKDVDDSVNGYITDVRGFV